MSLPNRKDLRSDLKTKIKADIAVLADEAGGVVHVFDYFTKDPGGISPFACIDSGNAKYSLDGDETNLTSFGLVIGFWALRDATDGADDVLDDLALALANLCRKYYNARTTSESVTDYEELEGKPYKFELHFIEFDT